MIQARLGQSSVNPSNLRIVKSRLKPTTPAGTVKAQAKPTASQLKDAKGKLKPAVGKTVPPPAAVTKTQPGKLDKKLLNTFKPKPSPAPRPVRPSRGQLNLRTQESLDLV